MHMTLPTVSAHFVHVFICILIFFLHTLSFIFVCFYATLYLIVSRVDLVKNGGFRAVLSKDWILGVTARFGVT